VLSPAEFREIVGGRRRGVVAALWRGMFSVVEPFYVFAVMYRNSRFDSERLKITRVDVPVVSVGNLTLGGTGKTPMVEWLARWFKDQGIRVALVSRGYGAKDGAANDEARELHDKLPDVPHLLNPKRVIAAQEAIEKHAAELIILDDGFQHRRLARDLDIVLVDATEPFGYEHVFPRGTLREPLDGFGRADVIALSRADCVDEPTRRAIRERIQDYNTKAIWLELTHAPRALRNAAGEGHPVVHLSGKKVLAFCGIGNPTGFRHVLTNLGYEISAFQEFPDHHGFSADDVAELGKLAEELNVDAVVCTHKDLVKLNTNRLGGAPLWAVEIGLHFSKGQHEFERRLKLLAKNAGL
jgi:tetraacyldisaccharide 4'-kinase